MRLTRRVTLDEGSVAWDAVGEGPPVVLVHGFPARAHLWREVAPVLADAGHRVYAYDLLGFGDSEQRDGQEVYFAGQARVLDALLTYWQLERPAVVAHDMGTGVAVVAATDYPRPFERLVLMSAAITNPVATGSTQHVQRHLDAYTSMPAATWAPLVRAKLATATHLPMSADVLEEYVRPWLGEDGQAAYLRLVAQIDEAAVSAAHTALGRLDMPTTVIWGEEDTWLPVRRAAVVRAAIPGAELRIVPGAGHFLAEDTPGALARLLVESLGGAGTTTPR